MPRKRFKQGDVTFQAKQQGATATGSGLPAPTIGTPYTSKQHRRALPPPFPAVPSSSSSPSTHAPTCVANCTVQNVLGATVANLVAPNTLWHQQITQDKHPTTQASTSTPGPQVHQISGFCRCIPSQAGQAARPRSHRETQPLTVKPPVIAATSRCTCSTNSRSMGPMPQPIYKSLWQPETTAAPATNRTVAQLPQRVLTFWRENSTSSGV